MTNSLVENWLRRGMMVVVLASLASCSASSEEPAIDMITKVPPDVSEAESLIFPIEDGTLPPDTGDRNISAGLPGGHLDEIKHGVISEGPSNLDPAASTKPSFQASVNLGGWWPYRGHVFAHLIQFRVHGARGGEAVFGRQIPAPLTSPLHQVMLQGMKTWAGPSQDGIQNGMDVLVLSPTSAQVRIHPNTLQEARVGDLIQLPNHWSWQVIALHAAEGELPAFLEMKLLPP